MTPVQTPKSNGRTIEPPYAIRMSQLLMLGVFTLLVFDGLKDDFVFMVSPKETITTTILRTVSSNRTKNKTFPVIEVHGQQVLVKPPLPHDQATPGQQLTVRCTEGDVCRAVSHPVGWGIPLIVVFFASVWTLVISLFRKGTFVLQK